jgi:hypothetical protein
MHVIPGTLLYTTHKRVRQQRAQQVNLNQGPRSRPSHIARAADHLIKRTKHLQSSRLNPPPFAMADSAHLRRELTTRCAPQRPWWCFPPQDGHPVGTALVDAEALVDADEDGADDTGVAMAMLLVVEGVAPGRLAEKDETGSADEEEAPGREAEKEETGREVGVAPGREAEKDVTADERAVGIAEAEADEEAPGRDAENELTALDADAIDEETDAEALAETLGTAVAVAFPPAQSVAKLSLVVVPFVLAPSARLHATSTYGHARQPLESFAMLPATKTSERVNGAPDAVPVAALTSWKAVPA